MRKNLRELAKAAEAQKNAPETALFAQAAPAKEPAEDTTPKEAPVAEVAPAPETPEVSQMAVVRDEAPAKHPFTPIVSPAPAPAPAVALAPAPAPRSLDDLLNLVNQAKSVTDRLKSYRATGEKLSSFVLSREGFTDRLTIKDGGGLEWSTNKSSIIQKVLELLRTDLSAAIEASEAELRGMLPAA